MKSFKETALEHCKRLIQEKLSNLDKIIDEQQQAANNETKSSMGDKYETGRSMAQLEVEKAQKQRMEILKSARVLHEIDLSHPSETVQVGSLVKTEKQLFLIAISLGILSLEGEEVVAISAVSPVGKQLMGKSRGDHFIFMGKQATILEVS